MQPGKTPVRQKALMEIKNARHLTRVSSGGRFLISVDLDGGRVSAGIAIGNLDTAGNVTLNVPGMAATVEDGLRSWT